MSRGLGIEQRNILQAAAKRPHEYWRRMALQQEAWGIRRPEHRLTVPEGEGTHPWVKNVKWWRDGKALTEGNFTRALQSLERRGLLVSRRSEYGSRSTWRITLKGLAVVNGKSVADFEHSEHLWLAEG